MDCCFCIYSIFANARILPSLFFSFFFSSPFSSFFSVSPRLRMISVLSAIEGQTQIGLVGFCICPILSNIHVYPLSLPENALDNSVCFLYAPPLIREKHLSPGRPIVGRQTSL